MDAGARDRVLQEVRDIVKEHLQVPGVRVLVRGPCDGTCKHAPWNR